VKPAPFVYHDPRSIADLKGLLASRENAKILAGGQSLMPMLNMRYVLPDHVIDINRIPELSFIRDAGETIEFGAMVRQRELLASDAVAQNFPLLVEAVRSVGHLQTRSRGTFGGSLCHLDPAAELPAVAAAFDATLTVDGGRGERTIAIADWGLGYLTPALEPDEVLTKITLPKWRGRAGHAFVEFARRHGDFAIVGVACLLALDDAGRIARGRIALSGVDVKPLRLEAAEKLLAGERPDPKAFAAAAAEARRIEALTDTYITAKYRQRVAGVLVERALALAAARAQGTADA
jgi:carbon-monoxide dehydrogenase medium subunit